ncbi:DUF1330 domain-containing protein [Burkholderiales bacterium]|nr:DUF1330 domain-containing protein [Burkholderiales bacterium]
MTAYLIAEITVLDPDGYEEYRAKVGASLSNYNAKFLVRGGEIENLEGEWSPQRLVICEFPDMNTIREWYISKEYQEIKKLRDDTAAFNLVSVSGI